MRAIPVSLLLAVVMAICVGVGANWPLGIASLIGAYLFLNEGQVIQACFKEMEEVWKNKS